MYDIRMFKDVFWENESKILSLIYYDIAIILIMNDEVYSAIKYLEEANINGNVDALYYLGNWYEGYGDTKMMMKYYEKAINENHLETIIHLGKYYQNKKEYELAEKYYKLGIEDMYCNYKLGLLYKEQKKYRQMILQFKIGCNNNYIRAIIELGNWYFKNKDYNNAIKLYYQLVKLKSGNGMYYLAHYYYEIKNDIINARKYLLMAIENNSNRAIRRIKKYYKILNNLLSLDDKDMIINKFKKQNMLMSIYYKNIGKQECNICFTKSESLILSCKHKLCYRCYNRINRCPYCRNEILK